MSNTLWVAVVALSVEGLFFGNGTALVAGLIIASVAIFLQTKEKT